MDTPLAPEAGQEASALRRLWVFLAVVSFLACAALAFARPQASWEWIPAILCLGIFGFKAARQASRAPYPNTVPALTLALMIPGYHVIAAINRERPLGTPELALDRAIGPEPAWMIAYGSIWFFAFLPVLVVRGARLSRRALHAFIAVVAAAYVGFLVYPTVLPRPEIAQGGFFAWALQLNYDLDPPLNCFPSLHVAWAFVAALACYRVHRGVGIAAQAWAGLIAVSTLYTKQHYFVDVVAGLAIAYLAYVVFLSGHSRDEVAEIDRRLAPLRAVRAVWIYVAAIAALWLAFTLGR
ncbi:MAG TPA: phosphatase PAP2 family protein [Usitatibacter sp.]|nr:phosphatase PAP2 family protein [Usitatibacter sp.]